ncbi:MAG: UbiX family flavin prenyltransferase [Chloroflexi bacterium]|nr:UbiX family flavin prenyltransferase [Chloroflexota bacterium]
MGVEAHPLVVGISGASGAALAQRCLEKLIERERPVEVVCTAAAQRVWQQETGGSFRRWAEGKPLRLYGISDIGAPIASGSHPTSGMLIVPCSMNTVAAIAHGLSGNLLERAADVTLKESRTLVLAPRETPLSVIHLTNLLTLARLGVRIVPPMPPFWARPVTMNDIVEYLAERLLVAVGAAAELPYWMRYGEGIR